jgi:hypothetical protein
MSLPLRSVSDHEILSRTQQLVSQERKMTLRVLLHLNEIERRKLYLTLGHASMFDYCTAGLGYSTAAAVRRIQTTVIVRFPGSRHARIQRVNRHRSASRRFCAEMQRRARSHSKSVTAQIGPMWQTGRRCFHGIAYERLWCSTPGRDATSAQRMCGTRAGQGVRRPAPTWVATWAPAG